MGEKMQISWLRRLCSKKFNTAESPILIWIPKWGRKEHKEKNSYIEPIRITKK